MVHLFLLEPPLGDVGNENAAQKNISLLQELESIIWSVIMSGGRSEARLWLCTTISCIRSITPHNQCELFVNLLRSKPKKKFVAARLVQMIFEKRPQKAGPIIAKKSFMLEKFFEGNPQRILQWFSNFSVAGEAGHRKGARALSQFAFLNRDICWEELEWKGKHGQSPAMVATKPHYFLDLDVLRTVENFLENVPDFWSSDEFAESLKDGEILLIDKKFFVDQFVRLMYEENSEDVWEMIDEFLIESQFSILSQHLLILLDEHELCAFLISLCKFLPTRLNCLDVSSQSYWLEIVLLTCNDHASIDELLLLTAVSNKGRQLLRLIHDDEHVEEKGKIEGLLLDCAKDSCDTDHWALMKRCLKMKKTEAIKFLGLQSWALHYILSRECTTRESCESMFAKNGISFQRSDSYSLVQIDRNWSDVDDGGSIRHRRKKKMKTSKKRKKYDHDDSSGDELWKVERSSGWQDLKSGGGSWLLSTDGYSCSWSSADLPEHISMHCFSTWMKWVCSRWSS